MTNILSRAGLLILAFIVFWLSNRLHKKAGPGGGGGPQGGGNKKGKIQKVIGTVGVFLAGCAFLGTFIGDWMGHVAGASPYIAGGFLLLSGGVLLIDWWSDGVPDRPAFWAAFALPIAVVIGFSQLDNVGNEIGGKVDQVSETIQNGSR